jgi:acyl-coenzyme A synthetase/AMP-(fatty) acid ligase
MYGQTEATARMAYLPHEYSLSKTGSMGIAIPGGKFSLIDADGNTINESEVVGELVYEGTNVTLGYAESGSDLAKGDERNGILLTGDMAKRDSDGFYYIVGRKKRFLKIFGSRVNLDETERLVKSSFNDFDTVCAGKDDEMVVFITDKTKEKEVQKFLAEKMNLNHLAFRVKYIESIPKNESGKTLYVALEKFYD